MKIAQTLLPGYMWDVARELAKRESLLVLALGMWVLLGATPAASGRQSDELSRGPALADVAGHATDARALSGRLPQRLRALRRLGQQKSRRALQLLLGHAQAHNDMPAIERLEVTAALVKNNSVPQAIPVLRRWLETPPSASEPASLEQRSRESGAMALALLGGSDGRQVLLELLGSDAAVAEPAAGALRQLAPEKRGALLRPPTNAPKRWFELLAELGDSRAYLPLRRIAREAEVPQRAAAAIALARLGHAEVAELALFWNKTPSAPLVIVQAATEILLILEHAEAASSWLALHSRDAASAATLANRYPHLSLCLALQEASGDTTSPELLNQLDLAAIAALCPTAVARSLAQLKKGKEHAVGRLLDAGQRSRAVAERVVGSLLKTRRAPTGHWLLAIALTEHHRLPSAGLLARLRRLGDDQLDKESLLRWTEGLLAPKACARWLGSAQDANQLRQVAAALGGRHTSIAQAALKRLLAGKATQETERALLLITLQHPGMRGRIPDSLLWRHLSAPTPIEAARRALLASPSGAALAQAEAWLNADSAIVRTQSALGLGEDSAGRSTTGLLIARYRREGSRDVRRALLIALGQRTSGPFSGAALDILRTAAQLEADQRVRDVARRALAALPVSSEPNANVWLHEEPSDAPFTVIDGLWPVPRSLSLKAPVPGISD